MNVSVTNMANCPSWNRLPRSEQWSLLGLLLVTVGALAFFSFVASEDLLVGMILNVGLAALVLVLGLTASGVLGVFGEHWRQRNLEWAPWPYLRQRAVLLGVWAACSLVAVSAFPKGNRVQMDEVVVLATSKAIHEEKQPVTPTMIQAINGMNKLSGGYVDKRPFLFAAVVSFCHDLRGYSPDNPFYCNMGLGVLTLALVGIAGARLGRSPIAGAVAMIALTAVPIFCEHTTGGGIDILNLAMLLGVALLAMCHLEAPTPASARALVGAGILLAYSRYESLLYAGIPVFVLLLVFWRVKRLFIDWSIPLLALGLVPLAGIHYLTFLRANMFFQLEEKGMTDAFSAAYIGPNLGHAVAFFLDGEHFLANSPLVFVLGVVAFVAITVTQPKRFREIFAGSHDLVFWLMAALVLGTFVLLMAYSWGELDQPVGSRLSLPLYVLLALSLSYGCREVSRWPKAPVLLCAALALGGYWSIFPVAAKQYQRILYATGRVLERFGEFVQQQPDRYFMVLNGTTNYWLTRDVYAVKPSSLDSNPGFLCELLKSREYRRVYLVQELRRDAESGPFTLNRSDRTDLPLETTAISDDQVTSVRRVRISLVKLSTIAVLERVIAERAAKAAAQPVEVLRSGTVASDAVASAASAKQP